LPNRGSFEELPDYLKEGMTVHFAKRFADVAKVLFKHGIPRDFAKEALKLSEVQGRFTVFTLVDALTRIAGRYQNAGDRLELDEKAAKLLTLAA
jgi:hypothetical protein